MDNNSNLIAMPGYTYQLSEEESAMMDVLNIKMMDLRCVNQPIHDICLYLCEDDNLQEFSSECGNSQRNWKVYDTLIKNQPGRLPAKTFLEVYFRNNEHVTLREFMRTLLCMRDGQCRIQGLLKALWNAALYGNSEYFRNVQDNYHNN